MGFSESCQSCSEGFREGLGLCELPRSSTDSLKKTLVIPNMFLRVTFYSKQPFLMVSFHFPLFGIILMQICNYFSLFSFVLFINIKIQVLGFQQDSAYFASILVLFLLFFSLILPLLSSPVSTPAPVRAPTHVSTTTPTSNIPADATSGHHRSVLTS